MQAQLAQALRRFGQFLHVSGEHGFAQFQPRLSSKSIGSGRQCARVRQKGEPTPVSASWAIRPAPVRRMRRTTAPSSEVLPATSSASTPTALRSPAERPVWARACTGYAGVKLSSDTQNFVQTASVI
jgi:hypothetical protein